MSVRAFGVKNLRCLKDSGLLRLKPITLLVGKNSSGKSTYLRAFPLFRQSLETPRSSPFLWFHPGYVDFGTLQEAVRRDAEPREVTFEVEVDIPGYLGLTLANSPVKVALTLLDVGDAARISRIQLGIGELLLSADFDAGAQLITLDVTMVTAGTSSSFLPSKPLWHAGPASWLPTLGATATSSVSYVRHVVSERDMNDFRSDAAAVLKSDLHEALSKFFQNRQSAERLHQITGSLSLGSLENMRDVLRRSHVATLLNERMRGLAATDPEHIEIASRTLVWLAPFVLQAADVFVADFMSGIGYLAPIRSQGARFHRLMDLGIEEIDPRGENLAMLLKSLSRAEMQSLAEFTGRHLGFSPSLRIQGMQAEIRITSPGTTDGVNLVDVGFGYSQVLPLAAMVWSACVRQSTGKRRRPTLLAMEQPELHMHPAFQGQLAAMLADASRQSRTINGGVPMIIETHSQALVNGLGALIEQKKLTRDEVQVVLFERDEETGHANVRVVEYDDQGYLIDWPYGFFSPNLRD